MYGLLEEVLIRVCGDFGVMAQRISKRTGVWTMAGGSILEKKIAAIGVHVSQGVTSHGFALNVTTDLRDFEWIVPCGITDRDVTSLELEARPTDDPARQPTMENALNSTARILAASSSARSVACVRSTSCWRLQPTAPSNPGPRHSLRVRRQAVTVCV